MQVHGSQWRLQTQFYPFGGPEWQQGDTRLSTSFEPITGLIRRIDGAARPRGKGMQFDNVTLICTCLDPETNPIPASNPYDFTILCGDHNLSE